jgi:hypothetical protein
MTPALAATRTALPPEGALAPWGGPAPLDMNPHAPHFVSSLPPEGALAPWGGPAPLDIA